MVTFMRDQQGWQLCELHEDPQLQGRDCLGSAQVFNRDIPDAGTAGTA